MQIPKLSVLYCTVLPRQYSPLRSYKMRPNFSRAFYVPEGAEKHWKPALASAPKWHRAQALGHLSARSLPPKHCYSMWCCEKRWQPTNMQNCPFLGAVTSGKCVWQLFSEQTHLAGHSPQLLEELENTDILRGEYKCILQN